MKVINYQCSLCDQVWEEKYVFGVFIEDNEVVLTDPEETEKHVCRGCVVAIKGYNENED
jgi:hypothetical protein